VSPEGITAPPQAEDAKDGTDARPSLWKRISARWRPAATASDADALAARIRIIAEDLATLEINTIKIPGLTARKMPSVHAALVQIAQQYDRALGEIDDAFKWTGDYNAIPDTFDRIGKNAGEASKILNASLEKAGAGNDGRQAQFVIVQRIQANAQEVLGVLKEVQKFTGQDPSSPDLNLAPQNQLRIRRIWDVGTEEVIMQTVVQLNGDVVTRVTEAYATGDFRILHEIHRDTVRVSLNMWKELVATVAEFFSDLVKGLKMR